MSAAAEPLRWGILGTARIATKVGAAIREADGAQLYAVASRSAERASNWRDEHAAQRSYGSYAELLEVGEIGAVYIPLPPSLHHEWTIRAAEKGKHVLCEKPLALNVSQAEEMAAACRENNVQLMDGVMWTHHPRTAEMQKYIQNGTLGDRRRVTSAFTFNWDEPPEDNIRLQPELGGGSLPDLGWYCVGATLWAFGSLPERVYATARFHNGVDVNLSAILWFDGRRMASFDCGFDIGMRKWFEVASTEGSLICDDFTLPWHPETARFWLHDTQGISTEKSVESRRQEVLMIEDFCELVRGGKRDDFWPQQAIDVQRVCDALAASARSEQVVAL